MPTNGLTDRATSALRALLNSLARRHEITPASVRQLLGLVSNAITSGGSASSTLIRTRDSEAAISLLTSWHCEAPAEIAMDAIRQFISSCIPVRTSDVSSLFMDCLTPAGGLIIKRAGYDAHKTDNAIRVVPLTVSQAQEFRSLISKLKLSVGDQVLLMRGNGSVEMGIRDQQLATDFGDALKIVTGDPSARFQSKRSATLQNIVWPGWEELAAAKLNGEVNPLQCNEWGISLQTQWTRTSVGATLAGHADLRSAVGHYLAAWPLIYGIMLSATLSNHQPGPKFLVQTGLSRDAIRQEKSRTTRLGGLFSSWGWMNGQLKRKKHENAGNKTLSHQPSVLTNTAPRSELTTPFDYGPLAVHYLTIRVLGLTKEESIEKIDYFLTQATMLDTLLNGRPELDVVDLRARSGAQPRGKAANIQLALSTQGSAIVEWLFGLNSELTLSLHSALFRQKNAGLTTALDPEFWEAVVNKLPGDLCIQLKIGATVATGQLQAKYSRLAPAIKFTVDPRVGSLPYISIHLRHKENRVVSARLSTVTRAASLAITILIEHRRSSNGN